jgi:membrane-associated protein
MELLQNAIDLFLHLDKHLNEWATYFGPWLYLVLFLIIFCETGLVVTPFLPGDSLLFAVGALAASPGSSISLPVMVGLLIAAAVAGDLVNYMVGFYVGPKVFHSETSRLLNKDHLLKTQRFYEKYGGKTIIIARFIPIIRTFAPFVAGIGKMEYRHFGFYNVIGGIAWVVIFLLGGFYFGEMEFVKKNFSYVVIAIVIISVMPPVIEYLMTRRKQAASEPPVPVESK